MTYFNLFPPSVFIFVMFLTSSLQYLPTSFCIDDARFVACAGSFQCSNIKNLSYPFWGGNRASYCGHPAFQLNCQSDVPIITFQSSRYRVLGIDTKSQLITVVRQDFWRDTCGIVSPPNSTDLDYSLFRHPPGDQNLTLSYCCGTVQGQQLQPYKFICSANETNSDSYFYTQAALLRPNLVRAFCSHTISIAINQTSAQLLTLPSSSKEDLKEVLKVGFRLIWEANDTICNQCIRSGGRCGYNSKTSSFACHCVDRSYASLCNVTDSGNGNGNNRNKIFRIKILGIGLAAAGIFIGCLIYFYKKQKKSEAVNAKEDINQHVEAFIRTYKAPTTQRYSYSDLKKMTNSFKEKLGQGGYGEVYKGKLADGRQVAVKVLNETKGNGEEFINEVASISRTSHVNVVTLLGFSFERGKRALIYEFMPNKSLDKFIHDDNRSPDSSQRLDCNILYQVTIGIARGLDYLHRGCNSRIVHFDIKPQNILLDEDFCPKISDFGLAKLCKTRESIISILGARGTAGYIAPEVFNRNFGGVSHKSDVYSYGMMVLEMAGARKIENSVVAKSSETYFPDRIYQTLEINALGIDNVPNNVEEQVAIRKMILVGLWCIQTIPADRPSMSRVVEMLEGSIQPLHIPPKPLLHYSTRSEQNSYISLQLGSENFTESTNTISL